LPSNEQQSGTSVQFFDITGKIMLNEPLNCGYVDVSALKPGLYLIKVTNSNGNIFVGKVIKNLR
jgi:serine protease inhibitor